VNTLQATGMFLLVLFVRVNSLFLGICLATVLRFVCGLGVGFTVGITVACLVGHSIVRSRLLTAIQVAVSREIGECVSCGNNLYGLVGETTNCHECGEAVDAVGTRPATNRNVDGHG
jgi:predicted RNA-binding Zn-ribbon protein involved in translation (DUF1610 family)